jgi:hypothetical protein
MRLTPVPLCGALVWRCCLALSTVAASAVRNILASIIAGIAVSCGGGLGGRLWASDAKHILPGPLSSCRRCRRLMKGSLGCYQCHAETLPKHGISPDWYVLLAWPVRATPAGKHVPCLVLEAV